MNNSDLRDSFAERYESGQIPWDNELPPLEVIDIVSKLSPGKALDIGSGLGRTSIYLAQHGWQVDGVDFIPLAIEESHRRAQAANVAAQARFYLGDVTDLGFLEGDYDLAIDIGCMHRLSESALLNYRDGLVSLLRSGALYLLFAHLRDPEDQREDAARWIEESALLDLFALDFSLVAMERGVTIVGDNPPWPSAWFTYRRL